MVITGTSYVRLHIPGEQVKGRPCTRRLPSFAKAWRREVNVSGGHEMLECHMTLLDGIGGGGGASLSEHAYIHVASQCL